MYKLCLCDENVGILPWIPPQQKVSHVTFGAKKASPAPKEATMEPKRVTLRMPNLCPMTPTTGPERDTRIQNIIQSLI